MMKTHEEIMFYERDDYIYRLVEAKDSTGESLYIVKDGDKPLLSCVNKEPAMEFFFYKCKKAEGRE